MRFRRRPQPVAKRPVQLSDGDISMAVDLLIAAWQRNPHQPMGQLVDSSIAAVEDLVERNQT